MAKWVLFCVMALAPVATAQMSPEEAYARLRARQAAASPPAATLPTSRPTTRATTDQAEPRRARKPAPKVVFVVDVSGSLMARGKQITDDLLAGINELDATQEFGIVAAFEEKPQAVAPKLLRATRENRDRAATFVKGLKFQGRTVLEPALRAAFNMGPNVIWIVSDGDYPDVEALLRYVKTLNAKGRVRINTVTKFASTGVGAGRVLAKLAHENGGVCIDGNGEVVPPDTTPQELQTPEPEPDRPRGPSIFRDPTG